MAKILMFYYLVCISLQLSETNKKIMLLTRVFPKSKIKLSVFCCLTNFIIRRREMKIQFKIYLFSHLFILYARYGVLFGLVAIHCRRA